LALFAKILRFYVTLPVGLLLTYLVRGNDVGIDFAFSVGVRIADVLELTLGNFMLT
jgi:hypothetical protein